MGGKPLLRLMCCLALLASACSSSREGADDPAPEPIDPRQLPPVAPSPIEPVHPTPIEPTRPLPPQELERRVPTDARPLSQSAVTPLPISGGTLLVTRDGQHAVASDPERARVSVVDLSASTVAEIALEPGDEPGRLVEDASGRIHVVLRGAGSVATLDLATGGVLERRAVCPSPRGIDRDPKNETLLVACASGELVTLPVSGAAAPTVRAVASDLRDVVVVDGAPLLTRFRSAEVLHVTSDDASPSSARPAPAIGLFGERSGALTADDLSPDLAYRLRRGDDGSLVMLHQVARDGVLEIGPTAQAPDLVPNPGSYTGGGSDECRGVVQVAVSHVEADGTISSTVRVPGTLAVDAALSSSGSLAVALAGGLTDDQPVPEQRVVTEALFFPIDARLATHAGVLVFAEGQTDAGPDSGLHPGACVSGFTFAMGKQVTSVAFIPGQDMLLALTREPAELLRIDVASFTEEGSLALGGASVADTGQDLFTRNAGSGMACASCHAEGGDDGHTWQFEGLGPRRTQSLHVGLEGTAPFHWQGDEASFTDLLADVMVGRMGGVELSPERASALEQFVYALPAPTPKRARDDPAALRGQTLFDGQAGCDTCHAGSRFSDGQAHDIGKGIALQVPSLIGIAYRTPLMHDGCAADLRERFDPACGGTAHGNTADLTAAQLDDLIAYLETL